MESEKEIDRRERGSGIERERKKEKKRERVKSIKRGRERKSEIRV